MTIVSTLSGPVEIIVTGIPNRLSLEMTRIALHFQEGAQHFEFPRWNNSSPQQFHTLELSHLIHHCLKERNLFSFGVFIPNTDINFI